MKLIKKIKDKEIPAFTAKIFVFLAILFMLDFSVGSVLKYFYFKQKSGVLYRTSYSLDSTRADFLILGSSTANHHYNSNIFQKRLRMSTYNTGRDANTIFYNYAVFQSVLERYQPKIMVLDFNVGELKESQDNYDRISSLLPYYKNHPEVHTIVQLKSPYEKIKLLSKIYPFNSLLFTIAIGTTEFNKSREKIDDENGYVPLTHVWNQNLSVEADTAQYELDTNKVNILKSLIEECKSANIQLYIVISPRFIKYFGNDLSIEMVRKIADRANIPFYDYSKDTLFWKHREYFADRFHLNNTGAILFSNKVADTILRSRQYLHHRNSNNLSIK